MKRQHQKKLYQYQCKVAPLCNHCDPKLCRTRKFGIGGGVTQVAMETITIQESENPLFFVQMSDNSVVTVTAEVLLRCQEIWSCGPNSHKMYVAKKQDHEFHISPNSWIEQKRFLFQKRADAAAGLKSL